MTRKTTPLVTQALTYESALHNLEGLILELDSGNLPLSQLMARYEQGEEWLAVCREHLVGLEQQITVLKAQVAT
jgi:exodeoxyribonuclease VII small subunit